MANLHSTAPSLTRSAAPMKKLSAVVVYLAARSTTPTGRIAIRAVGAVASFARTPAGNSSENEIGTSAIAY